MKWIRNSLLLTSVCALGVLPPAAAATYSEDFSGGLGNWTAGPSHLDSYGIVGGELFLDGWGHLTGTGGWGILQFNPALGSHFTATWQARITGYKYANFTLSAEPWEFDATLGYAKRGYLAWLDVDDAGGMPHFDLWKRTAGSVAALASEVVMPVDVPSGQTMNWRLEKNGASIKVWIDGYLMADVSDASFENADMKLGLSFGEDSKGYFDNLTVTVVPEPETYALLLAGLGVLGAVGRRRASKP